MSDFFEKLDIGEALRDSLKEVLEYENILFNQEKKIKNIEHPDLYDR